MLYYRGQILVTEKEDGVTASLKVWRVSDIVHMPGTPVWSARGPVYPPTALPPREWLLASLGALPGA